jgi:phosphoribosylpyrophosphate synthetase
MKPAVIAMPGNEQLADALADALSLERATATVRRFPDGAAGSVATWLHANLPNPLLIGPDEESAQWVGDVAQRAGAPFVVLTKTRHGDRDVEVSVPEVER